MEKILEYILTSEERAALMAACTSTLMSLLIPRGNDEDVKAKEIAQHITSALSKIERLQEELINGIENERRAH